MSRRFTFPATTLENTSTIGKKRTGNRYRTTSNEPSGDVDVSQTGLSNRTWDSTSTNSSLSDASSERSPHHLKVIYRNSEGKVCSYPVEDSEHYDGASGNGGHQEYSSVFFKFAEAHSCYDIIPTSARLIVFHTMLCVKKAFFALVFNGIRAAPVWDTEKNAFVGMLTVTDFIAILRKHRKLNPEELDQVMEQSTVQSWREILGHERHELICITPETSLREAVQSLVKNRVHRLPVIDPHTGNLLYILTHKKILSFLMVYWIHFSHGHEAQLHDSTSSKLSLPDIVHRTLRNLEPWMGTYSNLETVFPETPLSEVLRKFGRHHVSALPVIDGTGKLLDVYAKYDVMNLAANKSYGIPAMTVQQALLERSELEWTEEVCTCDLDDPLSSVLDIIIKTDAHRVIVLSAERVVGMVSLSDILNFLVLNSGDTSKEKRKEEQEMVEDGPYYEVGSPLAPGETSV